MEVYQQTLRSFCSNPENVLVDDAVDIFKDAYKILLKQRELLDRPAKPVNINDVIGKEIEPSTGEDIVIYDLLHDNRRTLLYFSPAPSGNAVMMYSAEQRRFYTDALYEEYSLDNAAAFTKAVKMAFSGA